MTYQDFIASKRHSLGNSGFPTNFTPSCAFDFQTEVIDRAVKKGRYATFLDTGLGKTLISLSIAKNVVNHTNKPVLILTPLAVAFQFVSEAEKIGVEDVEQSKDGKYSSKIVVANYERLHHFDHSDFAAVLLDESSILKNFQGSTRDEIVNFMKRVQYRYLSSATPAPNDFIELGNSSEALGHMGYMDMLTKFFKSTQGSADSNDRNIGEKFYLKPHAERDFFAWVNQWALMIKKPSDLGFSDARHVLPELRVHNHIVENNRALCVNGQYSLFATPARTMSEVRAEQKQTTLERCVRAVELSVGKTSVYWCNTNEESSTLKRLDPEAVEIIGSMSLEKKEEILIAFSSGQIKRIITKASMTSMGLNWQHCHSTVVFPTWSYEQFYQLIRRFWRFGQTMPVDVNVVISSGQERVMQALNEKMQKAKELFENLVLNSNRTFEHSAKEFDKKIIIPEFL